VKRARPETRDPVIEQCNDVIEEARILRQDIRASLALQRMLIKELHELSRSWICRAKPTSFSNLPATPLEARRN